MIETKTTKEISVEYGDLWLIPNCNLTEKGIKDKYKVWVSLEELKKAIIELRKQQPHIQQFTRVYPDLIYNSALDDVEKLCCGSLKR